jgi:predicted dinucleotide-binding enzyme
LRKQLLSHTHLSEVTMDIAIIGAGNVGKALTSSATRAGHTVVISSSNGDSARAAAEELGAGAAASNRAAVENADVVVLAVPYAAVDAVLAEIGPALGGKVLVDATNPIKPDYSGLATNGTSGAETIQGKAPGARVVKAFNTAFAARQADPGVAGGLRVDGYAAGDDTEAKQTVLSLLEALGFNPVDAGGLTMARYLEGMAWLNISLQLANGWSWQAGWKLVEPDGDAA